MNRVTHRHQLDIRCYNKGMRKGKKLEQMKRQRHNVRELNMHRSFTFEKSNDSDLFFDSSQKVNKN